MYRLQIILVLEFKSVLTINTYSVAVISQESTSISLLVAIAVRDVVTKIKSTGHLLRTRKKMYVAIHEGYREEGWKHNLYTKSRI